MPAGVTSHQCTDVVTTIVYRVSQKKVSLVKISCGKYNSGWWEIHEEFFDKSSCAALSNHWLLTNEVIY